MLDANGCQAFDHGTAHSVHDFGAAALWIPPGESVDEAAIGALFQETLAAERLEQAWTVLEEIDSYHPDEPFWYVPAIGTDPTQQRRGAGAALLNHALTTCDDDGSRAISNRAPPRTSPCTSGTGSRYSGRSTGTRLPPIVPMLREPQP